MTVSLRQVPLFHDLTDGEFEALKPCFREKKFEKGQVLFLEGKSCERVYIVKEGRVKLYRIAANGREQILEILEAGDTCACNPGMTSWTCGSTSEALERSTVWCLSREAYVRTVQSNSRFAQALNRVFAERLKCFSSLIEEVSLKDVKKRLVKFLLDMQESGQGGKGALAIPFTREEIAQRLGTARETVARYLYQLKRGKLIDIKPHQVILLNIDALKKLAES